MMDTYRLIDILKFWKGQRELDFQGVKVLLDIWEDDSISKERKYWMIIAGLRGLGLYEAEGSENNPENIERDVEKINDVGIKKTNEVGYKTELYELEIMNAFVGFEVFLN